MMLSTGSSVREWRVRENGELRQVWQARQGPLNRRDRRLQKHDLVGDLLLHLVRRGEPHRKKLFGTMRRQSFHLRAIIDALRFSNARLKLLGFCDVSLAAFLVAFLQFRDATIVESQRIFGINFEGLIVILHGTIQFALGTKFSTTIGIKYRQDTAPVFFRCDRATAGADRRIARRSFACLPVVCVRGSPRCSQSRNRQDTDKQHWTAPHKSLPSGCTNRRLFDSNEDGAVSPSIRAVMVFCRPCTDRNAPRRSANATGDLQPRKPITGIGRCRARTASGRATASPTRLTNSRCLIPPPEGLGRGIVAVLTLPWNGVKGPSNSP
jgi:hypothetical protein